MRPVGSPPAGLYIHVPFCTSVCPYCDFAVTIAGAERRAAWAEGILREAAIYEACSLEFDTVYFGGGTPSSLEGRSFADVLAGLRRRFPVGDGAWIHLEINPEDVTPDKVGWWRDSGVRFVSLGVQSFDDRDLGFLGRRHSAVQAEEATRVLSDSGFDTVSVDLIYGHTPDLPTELPEPKGGLLGLFRATGSPEVLADRLRAEAATGTLSAQDLELMYFFGW